MELSNIVGYTAALVGTFIFLPQAIKTIKTRETKSLSLPSFILISITNSLWLTYGLLTTNSAIILSQILVLPLSLIILAYKIKYG